MNDTRKEQESQQELLGFDLIQDLSKKHRVNDITTPWMQSLLRPASFDSFIHCGERLTMLEDQSREKKKLESGFFCKQRLCAGCAWREAVKNARCISCISQAMTDEKYLMLFVTLTVVNVPASELRDTIQRLGKAWVKLLDRKAYRVWGHNIRKVEVTYNEERKDYHPHLHCVVFVKKSYFAKGSKQYITQSQLLDDWRTAYGDLAITQVDVRRCYAKDNSTSNAILEVSKYSAKSSDYAKSQEVFTTMYNALYHTRLLTYAGRCKELKADYDAGLLDKYEATDQTEYIYRVVYLWQYAVNATTGEADAGGYVEDVILPYTQKERQTKKERQEAKLKADLLQLARDKEKLREWRREFDAKPGAEQAYLRRRARARYRAKQRAYQHLSQMEREVEQRLEQLQAGGGTDENQADQREGLQAVTEEAETSDSFSGDDISRYRTEGVGCSEPESG